MKHTNHSLLPILALALGSFLISPSAHAKQGATDPIPGTSKGATNSGGGGGGGSKTVTPPPTTTPLPPIPTTPVQPLVTGTLTMTTANYNGVTPTCTGTYRIDPYYPTLSLITVNVSLSSVSASDGSALRIVVTGTGGLMYPFLGGVASVSAGSASGSSQIYCTPGTVIANVTVLDAQGNIVATGK